MADKITLKLKTRDVLGKKVKRLRKAGTLPVHLYGPGIESMSLQCQTTELTKALNLAGRNAPITITLDGDNSEHLAFVREIQWDPIRGVLYHVDFLRAEATIMVSAEVPVVLFGESSGAKEVFGTVAQQIRTLTIEALPLDMPPEIRVDIAMLAQPGDVIRAADVTLPPEATLITNADDVVARIDLPRVEVEEEKAPGAEKEEVQGDSQPA